MMKILKMLFKDKIQFKIGSMASIVKWPDRLVTQNSAHTKSGFNIDYKPFGIFKNESNYKEIGAELIKTLNSNIYKIADPDFKNKNFNEERFAAAGVKSEREYMNRAKLITLHVYDNVLHLVPTKNGGSSGKEKGFSGIKEKEIIIDYTIDDESLGKIIDQLWNECIIWEKAQQVD